MLDYRIDTFVQLYKEMNYRKTAVALGMTQPGVTQHIQFLEKQYGVKLFQYDGHQLTCTREGEALKRHIDRVRAAERKLQQVLMPRDSYHLDIGATKTIGEYVLPPLLKSFLAEERHTATYVIDNTENLLRQLEDARLDFAVLEGVFDKKKYGFRLLQKEAYVGICGKKHPFAGGQIPVDEVFSQTLVLREPGSGTRRILEQAIQNRGYSIDDFTRCISVNNFSVIEDLVAAGQGITFGYTPVAKSREDLATFSVQDMEITGEFNIVYCDASSVREKVDLFFGEERLFDTESEA